MTGKGQKDSEVAVKILLGNDVNQRIELCHPHTQAGLDEAVYCSRVANGFLLFQLASKRSKYMQVNLKDKTVTFATANPIDDLCLFVSETVGLNEPKLVYLRSRATGKFLVLQDGELRGDGPRDISAQWLVRFAKPVSSTIKPQAVPQVAPQVAPQPVIKPQPKPVVTPVVSAPPKPAAKPPPPLASTAVNVLAISTLSDAQTHGTQVANRWLLETPQGRKFLDSSHLTHVKELVSRGVSLLPLLYRPDWIDLANRYSQLSAFPAYDAELAEQHLPHDLLTHYFDEGSLALPQLVSVDAITQARRVVSYELTSASIASSEVPRVRRGVFGELRMQGPILEDLDLMNLLLAPSSAVSQVLQRLLGPNEVAIPRTCAVIVIPPALGLGNESNQEEEVSTRWAIDVFNGTEHSPYTLIVGIALTDISNDQAGTYVAFEKSHVTLQANYKQQVSEYPNT